MNLAAGQPPNVQAPAPRPKQEQAPATQSRPAPIAKADQGNSNQYAEACNHPKDNNSAELCAQWRASIAAERSADAQITANYITGAGAFLSFVSIVLVLVALGQTRKANRVASATARHQLRAYIGLAKPDVDIHRDVGGELVDAKIEVQWRNVGQTPASKIRDRTAWGMFPPSGLPIDFDFPLRTITEDACDKLYLGPTQEFKSVSAQLVTRAEFLEVASGRQRLFIWAAADYVDVFGDNRRSELATELLVTPLKDGQHSFGFNAIPQHNGMDEDCLRPPPARAKPPHWLNPLRG